MSWDTGVCWPEYKPSRRERFRRWRDRHFGRQIVIPPQAVAALKASSVGLFNPKPELYAAHRRAMDQIAIEGFRVDWFIDPIILKYTIAQRVVNRFWRIVEWF